MALIGVDLVAGDATGEVPGAPEASRRRIRLGVPGGWQLLAAVAVLGVLAVLLLPIWLPDPDVQNIAIRLRSPSAAHLFGTDDFGRDVLSRVVHGARISWLVGLVASLCSLALGGLYGSASALLGKRVDAVAMRLLEILLAFPGPLLALVLAVAIGPGLRTVIIAIAVVYAAPVARLVRGLVLDELKKDYVAAARLIGSSRRRILLRHIVVNIAAPTLVFMITVAADAILVEAALAYLGAGVTPPTPSWGSMVQEGQNLVFGGIWWVSLFAGLAIALTVFVLNLLADSIVDAMRTGGRHG